MCVYVKIVVTCDLGLCDVIFCFYVVYSLLPSGFELGDLTSGICGSGLKTL